MNLKNKILIASLIMLFIISVGAVSAEEINNDTCDVLEVSSDVSLDDNQINIENQENINESSNDIESSITLGEISPTDVVNADLLGISLDEDNLLQANVITLNGTYFAALRDAISKASDGDTIDLEGKTIIAQPNGSAELFTTKKLTIVNGTLNAGNLSSITNNKRIYLENCILENLTFKNFDYAAAYPVMFINCKINHVKFENFTLAVSGFVIRNTYLYDVNFSDCHSTEPEDVNNYEHAAMCVAYTSQFDHCNFVNCTTNRHSGAICVAGEDWNWANILNSNFINCSAGIGGAIYVHGNNAISENYHSIIRNCTFIGNTATERGGALGSSQNYLLVEDCKFINNTAKQGAAYMLAGITHGLDGITEGHYNTMINCYFENNIGTEEGGAVHITGNNNKAINCTFVDNYATNGNGSAIYVHGENASVIDSQFYDHECSKGTVYIVGDNAVIDNSTFENNTASLGGGAVYVVGDNTLINNSNFNNNDAVIHGGAVHSHGNNLIISNSNFTSNTAIASTEDLDQGLGGAVYIKGNNSLISKSYFENNVARNGSAIYNRGENLTIEDDTFIENQAWSYLLSSSDRQRMYYDPEGVVTINVTLKGGDNIINAIYNDGSPDKIFFLNVTYESSVNHRSNTGPVVVNPVDGVEKSQNGTLIYQDSREDKQNITITVTHMETGNVVIYSTSQTGILGNTSVSEIGLLPGNYSVNITHVEDGLYKFITNMTYFEILPVADLAIEKIVSNKTPNFGDEITWTLKATNNGYNNVSDAYVIDKLPAGLIFNESDGKYNATTGRWDIGTLNVNQTVYLIIKTIVNITNTTVLNIATINSSTYDPNETNNVANNTTRPNPLSDLSVVKLVSHETSVIGDEITWTIRVTNKGPDIAVNAYAIDILPSTVTYVSDDSKGKYNSATGRWDIGNLAKGASAILNIKTKVNVRNTTIENDVFVNSSTPDSNMSNNNASNKTVVLDSNFVVEKNTITPIVTIGEQVKFQIVVRNTGLTNLTNVFVEEFSYDGLTFDKALNQTHWTESIVNGKHRWTLNNELGIGQITVLTVLFNTTDVGTFTNVVVAGSNETDNKTAQNKTVVVTPEFKVEKITFDNFVILGNTVTFEIVVTNTGLVNLTDVFVEEVEYDGLEYLNSYRLGNWTESSVGGKHSWTYDGVITPNTSRSFFVVFNTTGEGNFTNVVVAGANNTGNKTANNTTEVVEPKFVVEKIALNRLVSVGQQVTFEIAVTNTGVVDLDSVFVEESEYVGLVFDHAYGLGHWVESVVGDKHRWTYTGVFSPGKAHGFFVVFNTTGEGNFTNVVVAGANNTGNKTVNNTTEVVEPKFVVEKIALNRLVSVGQQVTFEIAVTNTGVVDLDGVFVEESEYVGLVFDHAYGLGHWVESVVGDKHRWTYTGVFSPGKAHGFFVVFNTTGEGNFTNVVVAGANNTGNKTVNNTTEVVEPKLSVEKITLTPVVPLNNITMFEIVVRNVGKITLTNVFIKETDYENLTYLTFSDNEEWRHNYGGNLTWILSEPLKPNEVAILTVLFNGTQVGNWTNTVTAGSDQTPDKTASNITEVVDDAPPFTPTNPNLTVEKIALDKTVLIGNLVTFDIVVTNTGDKILENITIHEKFDDGLQFMYVVDRVNHWIVDTETLTFTYNRPLYPNGVVVLPVVFNTTKAGNLMNIVTVTSNDTENKTSNDTIDVIEPKMEVSKVVLNRTVAVGDQVVFEILVRNTCDIALNNVLVNETSFDGLTFAGWYDDTGLWVYNDDLTWSLSGSLAPKEYLGFFVVFNTTSVGNFTNVVVVSSDEIPNETSNDTVEVLEPKLEVSKVVLNRTVAVGGQVVFEILVRNAGDIALNNVIVSEDSFDGLAFAGWYDDTGLWVYNDDLTWSLSGSLVSKEYLGFFVVFNTTGVGNFTNVVVVSSDEIPNETSNDTVEVVEPAFEVKKVSINPTVLVGELVEFQIIIHNTGKVLISNLTVNEVSFDGLEYIGWYDESNLWRKNDDLTWTLNSFMYPDAYVEFFVIFNTTKTGQFTNVIVVSSDEIPNKTANDTVEVVKPEFSVEKITVNKTVVGGDQVIFEIIINNYGKVDLNNVTVYESEFEGLTYAGWFDYTNKWIKNDDLSWTYNSTLESKKQADFFVVFNTTKVGNFTNVVVVKTNETEDKSANNTTSVIGADLSVIKFVSNVSPNYGDLICWTIIVTNNGPATAKDVYVVDNLPDGLAYQSSKVDVGAFVPATGIWSIGDLANGESVKMELYTLVTVSNSGIVNVAVVNGSTPDPNLDNNVANNTTKVNPAADLSVIKLVSNVSPNYGDLICWTIIVTNNGPDTAHDVYVVDNLPNGLAYQSSKVDVGLFDPTSGNWFISDLANGESVKMELYTLVTVSNSAIVNVAVVNGSTPDPNLDNNVANNTTKVNPAADLSIYKVVVAIDGDRVSWGIIVQNNGPDTAINTRVIDVLPKSLGFISYEASKGVFDYTTGVWSIGDMENGEEAAILIETIALESGEIINEARVESDVYDPNMTNNYDYDKVVVEDIPDEPVPTPEPVDVLPATGNPLIMVLLALIALATGTLRRRK